MNSLRRKQNTLRRQHAANTMSDQEKFYGYIEDVLSGKYAKEWAENVGNVMRKGSEDILSGDIRPFGQDDYNSLMEIAGFGGVTAFHGSPHKFSKFSTKNIGTGEGAQSYGHGLYFAENPKTAKMYQEQLRPMTEVKGLQIGGIPIKQNGKYVDYSPTQFTKSPTIKDYVRAKIQEDALIDEWAFRDAFDKRGVDGAKEYMLTIIDDSLDEAKLNWREAVPELEKIRKNILNNVGNEAVFQKGQSHLYKVDIADDAVKNFLDWDKPLSSQGKGRELQSMFKIVKETEPSDSKWLLQFDGETVNGFNTKKAAQEYMDNMAGSDFFKLLHGPHLGVPQKMGTNQKLMKMGVKGIRYLDQGSRQAGKGTSNYVVFDEDIIKMLERNGNTLKD